MVKGAIRFFYMRPALAWRLRCRRYAYKVFLSATTAEGTSLAARRSVDVLRGNIAERMIPKADSPFRARTSGTPARTSS